MNPDEIRLIVDQALTLIEKFYVHLPLKRAMHAVDPVQRLQLLRERAGTVRAGEFHREMVSIFKQLRDLHTIYVLPQPYRSRVAFLPFRVDEYFEGEDRRYVVTRIKPGSETTTFKVGVEVTHWNGTPISRAIELNADREAGSNPAARQAQGLAGLTQRSLAMSLPPDEEWVTVTYRAGKRTLGQRFDWEIFTLTPTGPSDPLAAAGPGGDLLGLDVQAEMVRHARKLLFDPEAVQLVKLVAAPESPDLGGPGPGATPIDFSVVSKLPDVFTFRKAQTHSGTFGYVRIHTFLPPLGSTAADIVDEFVRIVRLLPQNGLVLDVRGNSGGVITAGERLLQTLTPKRIEPERFHFIPSPLTLKICQTVPGYNNWLPSLMQAASIGAAFSDGFPLLPVDHYNDLGQQYQGRVVLVIDARCYSTTDIFAAGFQDHAIGTILGTSKTTGAGGANVWTHALLQQYLPGQDSPIQPLPGQTSFNVAVRRCTRVGENTGRLVEDLGVVPEEFYDLTKNDVLKDSIDLISHAAGLLVKLPVWRVVAEIRKTGAVTTVVVTTQNVDRIDILLDGRTRQSLDVTDGSITIEVSALDPNAQQLRLDGYHGGKLVASTRAQL